MKRFTLLLILALALVPGPVTAQPPSLSAPAPAELTLPNGLNVVLADDALAAGVAVAVEYAVGHADDPPSHRGLSHLIEHLTFRGSTHLRAFEADDILGQLSAGYRAFTTLERTVYLTALPARALETVLWLESERMAFTLGRLDEAALAIEKRIVTNELREREQTRSFVLWRRRQQSLYGASHPFTPPEDAARALDGIELQGLRGFFQRTYRPDNARLIIAGQFQRALARTWVEKYFAGIVSSPLPRARLSAAPPTLCGAQLDVGHPFLLGSTQSFSWLVPASPDAAQRAAFEVLRAVLEARLESLLVHEKFLAGSVSASVARHRTHGLFSLDIEMQDTEVWDAARNVALQEVMRMTEQPISSDELSNARSRLISRYVFDRTDAAARALALVVGEDPDAEGAALDRVDAAAVLAAARPLRGPSFAMTGRPQSGASVDGVVLHESKSCR